MHILCRAPLRIFFWVIVNVKSLHPPRTDWFMLSMYKVCAVSPWGPVWQVPVSCGVSIHSGWHPAHTSPWPTFSHCRCIKVCFSGLCPWRVSTLSLCNPRDPFVLKKIKVTNPSFTGTYSLWSITLKKNKFQTTSGTVMQQMTIRTGSLLFRLCN